MATYTDNYNLVKPTMAETADIRTINGNMDTIDDVLHASQVSLADAYDETRTASNPYNTGDIVMYELLMYKCLEDGVYGTWDGTKWERTTAGANGGGSDVEVTPSYNSGTKIAEIDVDGDTEEIYVPEMTGASSSSDGTAGLPPAPEAGDEDKFFRGDGTWAEVGGVQQVYGSSSGNIATFDDGGDNKPLKSLKVAINPVQDLHGYDHPWAGGAKGNLFVQGERKTETLNGVTITSDGFGRYTVKGTATANGTIYFNCDEYTTPNGSDCTIIFWNDIVSTLSFRFFKDSTTIDSWALNSQNRRYYGFGTLSQKVINKYGISFSQGSTYDVSLSPMFVMGNFVSNPPAFIPYSNICPISGWDEVKVVVSPTTDAEDGTTYTISLSETMYGGNVRLKDGTRKETQAYVKTTWLGSEYWAWNNTLKGFRRSINASDMDISDANLMCEILPKGGANTDAAHIYYHGSYIDIMGLQNIGITDANSWKAFINNIGGITLTVPLATPTETETADTTQIFSLLGNNNIWSNTGEILECVYQRDLNIVINQFDARITALEQALNNSGTRSLSLSKSATKEEIDETKEESKEEVKEEEETKEEEQNEDKR